MKTRDLEVLQRLGLEDGVQMSSGKAWMRIRERLTLGDVVEISQGCEWLELGYCAEGLRRLGIASSC